MRLGIRIENSIKNIVGKIRSLCIECEVVVNKSSDQFWKETQQQLDKLSGMYKLDDISKIPANKSTRQAYRALGKDPSRYRPSAEALLRRVLQGKGLYKVNNVVDCLNLISVVSGYSIGGFDADRINGEIVLSTGDQREYVAIGRGLLNIENLPALRDDIGFFGTPTSDSERTKVTDATRNFLMVFYDFYGMDDLNKLVDTSTYYLKKYSGAEKISHYIYE